MIESSTPESLDSYVVVSDLVLWTAKGLFLKLHQHAFIAS